MASVVRGAALFVRAFTLLKIAVWWVFLPVFGLFCVLRWLLLPGLLLAGMGLALGIQILRHAEPGTPFHRLPLRIFGGLALFTHGVVIVSALVLLGSPWSEGWTELPGSSAWSDPVARLRADGELVVITGGRDKDSYWRAPGGATLEARGLPGLPGWLLADQPGRGRLWLAPRAGAVVTFYSDAQARWLEIPAPIDMTDARGLAIAGDRIVLATHHGLYWTDDARDGWALGERGYVAEMASDPTGERLLALGPRFLASSDGGRSWSEVPRPEGATLGASAAIGGDGRVYVVDGGIVVGGDLWTAPFGGAWERRVPPAGDLRAVAVDPRESDHLVVGAWGEGVFRSRDGGREWASLGLRGVSVRSLDVDFERGEVVVGSGNLVIRGGVFTRSIE
ncbi:MAG: hypothetical protein R3B09_24655 [Nannocystaceae bacterium]